ncbi:MAG TPA: DUF2085 domain-containing protein [Bacteroidota bacterium]|nr:DUF2085 domain-containing protein [Bacteroidota bacterium]
MKNSYRIILLSVLIWCAAILAAPLLASVGSGSGNVVYRFFSTICHQFDERSLHLFGFKLAVCARCSGIYFGFLVGAIIFPISPKSFSAHGRFWLIVSVTPMSLDVLLSVAGIHGANIATRLTSGLFFGIISALVLMPSMIDGLVELKGMLSNLKLRLYRA